MPAPLLPSDRERRFDWKLSICEALDRARAASNGKAKHAWLAESTNAFLNKMKAPEKERVTEQLIGLWLNATDRKTKDVRVPHSEARAIAFAHALEKAEIWAEDEREVRTRAVVEDLQLGFRFARIATIEEQLFRCPIAALSFVCKRSEAPKLKIIQDPRAWEALSNHVVAARNHVLVLSAYARGEAPQDKSAPDHLSVSELPGYFFGVVMAMQRALERCDDKGLFLCAWRDRVRFAVLDCHIQHVFYDFCQPRHRLLMGIETSCPIAPKDDWHLRMASLMPQVSLAIEQFDDVADQPPFAPRVSPLTKEACDDLSDVLTNYLHLERVWGWYRLGDALTAESFSLNVRPQDEILTRCDAPTGIQLGVLSKETIS